MALQPTQCTTLRKPVGGCRALGNASFTLAIGENSLPFEDSNTLLVQVEGCLNYRLLTPLADDPTDLEDPCSCFRNQILHTIKSTESLAAGTAKATRFLEAMADGILGTTSREN